MRIPRIYLPSKLQTGQSTDLSDHAFQHVIKVLRLKQDEKLIVFDGQGNEFFAHVETVNKKNATVIIAEPINSEPESPLSIHLGLGISKGERMDFAIQKAVELGVTEITPLFTEHCVVNLDEKRIIKRLQHWQGIIISACEQCGRNCLPILNTTNKLTLWADSLKGTCLIFDPIASSTLKNIKVENDIISLVIGPEGGLSNKEISDLKMKDNFQAVKFGPRILRTETAAVSAITALQVLWGDIL